MDLIFAFDCIPHNLLIARHSPYGLNGNALKYNYTNLKSRNQSANLKSRNQSARVSNVCSALKDVILGVLQDKIIGPMSFNAFLNNFFFAAEKRLYIILLMIIRYHNLQILLCC